MENVEKVLKDIAGIDEHLDFIMRELEYCDDKIYNENLSSSNFIYCLSRKIALQEVRDNYCKLRKNTRK